MILPYIFAMANMGPTWAIPLGPTHLTLVWADPNGSLWAFKCFLNLIGLGLVKRGGVRQMELAIMLMRHHTSSDL